MSDEALVIGGAKSEQTPPPAGQSGLSVPTEIMSISVFGILKDSDEAIEQTFQLNLPHNVPEHQAALFVWDQVAKLGALTTTGKAGEYNFYPLPLFKRLALKFGKIVGVTL